MIHRYIRYLLHNQLIFALNIIILGWLIVELRDILVIVFISYIIMATLLPMVNFLHRKKVPKVLAVVITYVVTLIILAFIIFPLIPFFTAQIETLILSFPKYLNDSARLLHIHIRQDQIQSFLSSRFETISENAFMVTTTVIGRIFSLLTVFVISFYLLLTHDGIQKNLVSAFSKNSQTKALDAIKRVDEKMGDWMRGQLVLSLFVGVLTWIALFAIGFKFALPLAVIAGILEIVPTLGPILSAIPAVIVALSISPTSAIIVVVIYIAVQTIESNILVPRIMNRAVGLNPVAIILAIIIGGQLLGIAGALLSIPFLSLITVLYNSIKE